MNSYFFEIVMSELNAKFYKIHRLFFTRHAVIYHCISNSLFTLLEELYFLDYFYVYDGNAARMETVALSPFV